MRYFMFHYSFVLAFVVVFLDGLLVSTLVSEGVKKVVELVCKGALLLVAEDEVYPLMQMFTYILTLQRRPIHLYELPRRTYKRESDENVLLTATRSGGGKFFPFGLAVKGVSTSDDGTWEAEVRGFKSCAEPIFLVGAFRRKTQTIVLTFLFLRPQTSIDFFKTNEVTDFISFICWLPLTATLM